MAPPPSSNRRASTRQVRTSRTGPTNYYGRYGPRNSIGNAETPPANAPQTFCPAISHFTRAVDALPKELIKQFSLLKEVEGKAHEHETNITTLFAEIDKLPTLSRAQSYRNIQPATDATSLPSATNSVAGSVHPDMLHLQMQQQLQQRELFPPDFESLPAAQQESLRRRQIFHHLRVQMATIMQALEDKTIVLSKANQLLRKGLMRMESSYKYVGEEVSDEARFGSLNHWAFAEKEEKKKVAGPTERSRRDVANANLLVQASSAVEEHAARAAAHRSEARRGAVLAKRSRQQQVDSDFDERPPPKKSHAASRARNASDAGAAGEPGKVHGLGITNGIVQPAKKRKTEKTVTSAPMERSMSGAVKTLNASKTNGGSPRETPNAETTKKRPKMAPTSAPAKKKNPNAAVNSPAPSPALPPLKDIIGTGQPQSSRGRRDSTPNSNTSNRDVSRDRRSPSPYPHEARVGKTAAEIAHETSDRARREMRKAGNGGATPRELEQPLNEEDSTLSGITKPIAATASSSIPGSPALGAIAMGRSRSTRNNGKNAGSSHASSESNVPLAVKASHKKRGSVAIASAPAPIPNPTKREQESSDDEGPSSTGGDLSDVDGGDDEPEDEQTYCICNGPGFGNMIGCDNEHCSRQWFHWECVGITKEPSSKTKWYCDECKENMKKSRPASRA